MTLDSAEIGQVLYWAGAALIAMAISFFGTILIELPVAHIMGIRGTRGRSAIWAVNLLTNPLTVSLFFIAVFIKCWLDPDRMWLAGFESVIVFLMLEAVVIVVEWRLLRWALLGDSRRPLLASAVMNIASAAAGLYFSWYF